MKMKKLIQVHKADTRGGSNLGWLNSSHTFSFADYHEPNRMNFGALRVLNDDRIAPNMGFESHPHKNMEIISIPLEGELEHIDNMNNLSIIKKGEIQIMSAGSGVTHSEKNNSDTLDVKFLQIWIIPNKKNVTPRYDQIKIKSSINRFNQILSPNRDDLGVWIHQEAWFHIGEFNCLSKVKFQLKNKKNGLYAFIIKGEALIEDQKLEKRDGIGITGSEFIDIKILPNSTILLMEVPMEF